MAERGWRERPNFLAGLRIAAAKNACAGRLEEARGFIARALELDPELGLSNLRDRVRALWCGAVCQMRRGPAQGGLARVKAPFSPRQSHMASFVGLESARLRKRNVRVRHCLPEQEWTPQFPYAIALRWRKDAASLLWLKTVVRMAG